MMKPASPEDGQHAPDIVGGEGALGTEFATMLFEFSPLGVFLSDSEGRCIHTNDAYRQMAGLTARQALGMRWSDSVHPEDRQRILEEWEDAVASRKPFRAEARFQCPDDSITWVRLNAGTGPDASEQGANLLMVEDIAERKAAELLASQTEEVLYAEKERAQVTLDSIGDAVLVSDLAGSITYMNLEAVNLTGWSSESALGRPLTDVFCIVNGETGRTAPNPAQRAIDEDRTVGLAADCLLVRRDGSEVAIEDSAAPVHSRDGTVAGAVIVFHDVAQSREHTKRMSYLAQHDQLTGLVRPVLLGERLSRAISLADRHYKQVGLLFMDLDGFKKINDVHGHEAGDQVLVAVAARLAKCVRESDTVCRHGGDEFVILLTEIADQQDAAVVAEKVLAALAKPHIVEGATVFVSCSIGISVYPYDGRDEATLMRSADTAMYQAKRSSTVDYCFAMPRQRRDVAGAGHGRPRPDRVPVRAQRGSGIPQ